MAAATVGVRSVPRRYAWTVFVAFGGILVLFGVSDFFSGSASPISRENAINELLIGLFGVLIAAYALRRGERWAWYAMSLWPLWMIAQTLRAWSSGKNAEAISAVVLLVVALGALALSYRRSFHARS